MPADKLSLALNSFRMVLPLDVREKEKHKVVLEKAVGVYGAQAISRLQKSVRRGAEIISEILMNTPGIGFAADKETQANKQVFAILGPNMGKYGNREVAIVFKRDAMEHPDSFMTPFAAMGYYQGWYIKNSRVGIDRPWGDEARAWGSGGRVHYQKGMFQAVTDNWSGGCASEWIARVAHDKKVDPNSVTLRDVQDMIYVSDPHTAVEMHLPSYVPLEYVQKVYIKRGLFDPDGVRAIRERVDAVEVDNPVETVYTEMCKLRNPSGKAIFSGYRFSVEPWSGECTIPICLPKHGSVTQFICTQKSIDMWISLRQVDVIRLYKRSDEDRYLCERPNSTENDRDEVRYVEMCAHVTEHGVAWHNTGIKEGMGKERVQVASRKEKMKPSSNTFKYRIVVDPTQNVVRIEFWEVLCLDPDKKMGIHGKYEQKFTISPTFLSLGASFSRVNVKIIDIPNDDFLKSYTFILKLTYIGNKFDCWFTITKTSDHCQDT